MHESNNSYTTNQTKFFGDAVFIALITALGYLVTGQVELNYIGYFGFPVSYSLIMPSIIEIISLTFITCLIIYFFFGLSRTIYKWLTPKNESPETLFRSLSSLLIAYYFSIWMVRIILYWSIKLELFLELFAVILTILLLSFLMTRLHYEEKKSRLDSFFPTSHIDAFLKKTSREELFFIFFIIIYAVFTIAPTFGYALAKNQTAFGVINSTPELAIIVNYSDLIIAAPFDKESKSFKNEMHLIKPELLEEHNLSITRRDIGPLAPSNSIKGFWEKMADKIRVFYYALQTQTPDPFSQQL